jgi:hypothetical protein
MWISSHSANTACHSDDRTDFCANRYSDTGNAHRDADAQANIDTRTQTHSRCNASATTDDASTRLDAAYP